MADYDDKHPLKAWGDTEWTRQLTDTLTVSRVDEDIPTEQQSQHRKPWYVALTQRPNLLTDVGKVAGLPKGHTLLLSEDDVLALVRYLLEPQVAMWAVEPTPSRAGDVEVSLFLEPGMVKVAGGEPVNGEAHWSPAYFTRQKPLNPRRGLPARKVHTLPWKMVPSRSR